MTSVSAGLTFSLMTLLLDFSVGPSLVGQSRYWLVSKAIVIWGTVLISLILFWKLPISILKLPTPTLAPEITYS